MGTRKSVGFALILALALAATAALGQGGFVLPGDGFAAHWERNGQRKLYSSDELARLIAQDAGVFREFGFIDVTVQTYSGNGNELTLEVYRMDDAEAALGIFLNRCRDGSASKSIRARNRITPSQAGFIQGRFFVRISSVNGSDISLVPIMNLLAEKTLAALPRGDSTLILLRLPQTGLLSGSEQLVRGPLSLKAIHDFGPSDPLRLGGKVWGVAGKYLDSDGEPYTRLLIDYPDTASAANALTNVRSALPDSTVLQSADSAMVFACQNAGFGLVSRSGIRLELTLHLVRKPELP